jgi:hypothetical protein
MKSVRGLLLEPAVCEEAEYPHKNLSKSGVKLCRKDTGERSE